MKLVVASLVLIAACSDDAPGTPLSYTGGYEDWDSTDDVFMGVFEATVTEVADPTNTATTAPNGRSTLELPGSTTSEVTWEKAGYVLGRATVDPGATLGPYELRGLSEARVDTLHTELGGATYDDTRALVLIEVRDVTAGVPVDGVTVAVAGAGAGFHDDATHAWQAGATTAGGRYVVFPNVPPGELALTITGGTCHAPTAVIAQAGEVAEASVYCE